MEKKRSQNDNILYEVEFKFRKTTFSPRGKEIESIEFVHNCLSDTPVDVSEWKLDELVNRFAVEIISKQYDFRQPKSRDSENPIEKKTEKKWIYIILTIIIAPIIVGIVLKEYDIFRVREKKDNIEEIQESISTMQDSTGTDLSTEQDSLLLNRKK